MGQCVCVCCSWRGRGAASWGCHGNIGFPSSLHLHPQMTPPFPDSPWPNLRTSSETSFVLTISSMPMRQGKLATGPNLLNGCPDRKNKTHSSTFIFLKKRFIAFCSPLLLPISRCPFLKKGLNNMKTFFLEIKKSIYLYIYISIWCLIHR